MHLLLKLSYPLSIILFVVSCGGNKESSAPKGGGSMAIEAVITHFDSMENTFRTPGNVMAGERVDIQAEMSGRVIKINFSEGSQVSKGQLLVQIDDTELQTQLRKYEAQLRIAREDENRKKELLSINGISQEIYNEALSTREQLEADIDLVRSKIDKARIVAPFSGRLGLRAVSEGAYLTIGEVIATLAQTDPIKLEFNIPEKYTRYVVNDLQVDFTVIGTNEKFNARVYAVEPSIDATTRTIKVRARTQNTRGKLLPGAYADLTLNFEQLQNVIMVPTQAIIPSLNSQNVFIMKNGKAKLVAVTTGIQTDRAIQITNGLAVGDTVAMTGILALKEGMPIVVSKVVDFETGRP